MVSSPSAPYTARQRQVFDSHLYLVDAIMRSKTYFHIRRWFPSRDELRSEAFHGLLRATTRYDDPAVTDFPRYALRRIVVELRKRLYILRYGGRCPSPVSKPVPFSAMEGRRGRWSPLERGDFADRSPSPLEAAVENDLADELTARLSDFNADIVRLRLDGYTDTEIGARMNRTREAINNRRRAVGRIYAEMTGHDRSGKQLLDVRMRQFYDRGWLDREIAASTGRSRANVCAWRHRHNLPVNRAEASV